MSSIAKEHHHMFAGISGGFISTVILNPIDVIKTRYQVYDGKGSAYSSIYTAIKTIHNAEGIRGFFSGLVPASIASTISWGGYFYFYESSKNRKINKMQLNNNNNNNNVHLSHSQVLLSGIEAGSIMVFFTNPLWLIKTRLQLQGGIQHNVNDIHNIHQKKYTGFINALFSIVREEGLIGLYKGVIPALFLTSHGAIQFVAYEYLKKKAEHFGFATRINNNNNNNNKTILEIPMIVTMCLGLISKLFAATITYPYQVIKSRLQQRGISEIIHSNNTSDVKLIIKSKYSGTIDCILQIIKKEGIIGFYKGYIANCIKVAPTAAITFAVYEKTLFILSQFEN